MKQLNDYMKEETRDNSTKYWTTENETLRDLIRDLHGDIFPTDGVFASVADIIQEASDYETFEDAESSEGNLYPIYYAEIRKDYCELSAILNATFDNYKDYFFIDDKDLSPMSCEKAHLYAYISWCRSCVLSFLESDNFWNTEEENNEEVTL